MWAKTYTSSKPTFSTNPYHLRFPLPTGLPQDNGTGPVLSRSSFYYLPFASIAKGEVFVLLCFFVTRHSLVRALERRARYLVYCMFVCLFVRSTISRQPAGRFTPKFACRRTLVPDVSSPFLGVGGPRRAEKWANEIFVTMGVNGEFLHFGGF